MVRYTPNLGSTSWNMKSESFFETVEEMKQFIAERVTVYRRFAGKNVDYSPSDVVLQNGKILLDGLMVGYCGE